MPITYALRLRKPNGNLKIWLKEPIDYWQVYSLWNKIELAEILEKLDLNSYQLVDQVFDEFSEGIPPAKVYVC